MPLTMGTDAEFLFCRNGVPQSVEGLLGGTKGDAVWHEDGDVGYEEDNVAGEIKITPCTIRKDFIHKILKAKTVLASMIPQLEMSNRFDEEYTPEQLATESAKESGCSPTFNAWKLALNPHPEIEHSTHRYAGGDLHIGFDAADDDRENRILLTKALDLTLGLIGKYKELSIQESDRRNYYGYAGSFRYTDYGIEYKVLSNWWLGDISTISSVWDISVWCVNNFDTIDTGIVDVERLINSDRVTSDELLRAITQVTNTYPELNGLVRL